MESRKLFAIWWNIHKAASVTDGVRMPPKRSRKNCAYWSPASAAYLSQRMASVDSPTGSADTFR